MAHVCLYALVLAVSPPSAGPWLPRALHFPPEMEGLQKQFGDVFGEVPHGLPLDRNVGHTIPLEPGSAPPYRSLYPSS